MEISFSITKTIKTNERQRIKVHKRIAEVPAVSINQLGQQHLLQVVAQKAVVFLVHRVVQVAAVEVRLQVVAQVRLQAQEVDNVTCRKN